MSEHLATLIKQAAEKAAAVYHPKAAEAKKTLEENAAFLAAVYHPKAAEAKKTLEENAAFLAAATQQVSDTLKAIRDMFIVTARSANVIPNILYSSSTFEDWVCLGVVHGRLEASGDYLSSGVTFRTRFGEVTIHHFLSISFQVARATGKLTLRSFDVPPRPELDMLHLLNFWTWYITNASILYPNDSNFGLFNYEMYYSQVIQGA